MSQTEKSRVIQVHSHVGCKTANNKQTRQTHTNSWTQATIRSLPKGKGGGEVGKGKGDQMCDDRRLDFGWLTHNAAYRCWAMELCM